MKPCDEYKKIILASMQSVLKPHGYRKKQSTFQATRGDTELLVMLQKQHGDHVAAPQGDGQSRRLLTNAGRP